MALPLFGVWCKNGGCGRGIGVELLIEAVLNAGAGEDRFSGGCRPFAAKEAAPYFRIAVSRKQTSVYRVRRAYSDAIPRNRYVTGAHA
jgi:hypothetical protein